MPRSLAPTTVRLIAHTMSKVFKFGVKRGHLKLNPFNEKRIELPPGCTKRLKTPIQYTPAQFTLLRSNLDILEKLAVTFAGWIGTRVSEMFGLQWQDLNLPLKKGVFRRGLREGRISPLKTAASRTDFPIPNDVLELLTQWKALTPYNRPTDWVFASPRSKGNLPYWPNSLLVNIQRVARRLGLPRIAWHGFRHSFGAWIKEAHMTPEEIKTMLRHQTLKMGDEYGTLGFQTKQQLQRKLSRYIRKQSRDDSKSERSTRCVFGKTA
jgi:integrase